MWTEYRSIILRALSEDENYDDLVCALDVITRTRSEARKRAVNEGDKKVALWFF